MGLGRDSSIRTECEASGSSLLGSQSEKIAAPTLSTYPTGRPATQMGGSLERASSACILQFFSAGSQQRATHHHHLPPPKGHSLRGELMRPVGNGSPGGRERRSDTPRSITGALGGRWRLEDRDPGAAIGGRLFRARNVHGCQLPPGISEPPLGEVRVRLLRTCIRTSVLLSGTIATSTRMVPCAGALGKFLSSRASFLSNVCSWSGRRGSEVGRGLGQVVHVITSLKVLVGRS